MRDANKPGNTFMNQIRAGLVLHRRGMVDILRPWQALQASAAMRRYGPFGGLAMRTATRYGDAPAVTDERGTWSFRELDGASNALARGLTARSAPGVPTVGLLSRAHRGFLLGLMAADKAGSRIVLLNTGFAGPQLADVCDREKIGLVLADQEFEPLLSYLPEDIERVALCSGESALVDVDDIIRSNSRQAPSPPRSHGGLVLLTSGTTGIPKGAPRNGVTPLQSAQLLDRIPWPSNSAYFVAAPLFHATGLATSTIGLALGNRIIMTRRFDPRQTLAAIAEYGASTLVVVPTMLSRILDLGPEVIGRYDTSSLRVLFVAGSALSPDLCVRAADVFGDVLYNLYGSTEVATASVATPAELRIAPGTVGRPPLGCVIAAYDDRGCRIIEPDTVGTLYVSSGLSFAGYTGGGKKKSIDGLLCSGDTGHFNAGGLWFVDGREDDMIVSGGENVYPIEVENLLCEHPDVADAAVLGVPDLDFGERLCAFVVLRGGVTLSADEIRSHVRAHLARHKVPRDVIIVDELPRNETGKVLKNRLAERVRE